MKYLSLVLVMALCACGSQSLSQAPSQPNDSSALESPATREAIAPRSASWCDTGPVLKPAQDSVMIFKGTVGDNIPLLCRTNVPVNTTLVARFQRSQTPSAIRVTLTPSPFMGLSCGWSADYKTLTCSSNVMSLGYDTIYTFKVFYASLSTTPFGVAVFRTESDNRMNY